MNRSKFKTPIAYYGGKQSMINDILPLIPEHDTYIEPFFGGGAIFWAKAPVKSEVINDANSHVINFFEVLKHDFFKLREAIEKTLHSRDTYKHALTIYNLPHLFDRVQRAWAFWVVTNQGFATKIGTWGYDRKGAMPKKVTNKIEAFKEHLEDRMRYTTIDSDDAVKIIKTHDCDTAFVYVDPPYVGSNQGHYGGYTEGHFEELLLTLSSLKGRFLLSSYPSEILERFIQEYDWTSKAITKSLSANKVSNGTKRGTKTEVLTANFKI